MESFIPSRRFAGARPGYVFKNGDQGVGYYPDIVQQRQAAVARADAAMESEISSSSSSSSSEPPSKRPRGGDADGFVQDHEDEEAVARDAAAASVELITEDTLQQVLLSFEKKVSKNQLMRAKFPDQPEKFLDSEVDLHQEVLSLYALAASPELYPLVVKLSAVPTILGMIAHENTDISLAAVGLIQEMTDPETYVGNEEDVGVFIEAFVKDQGLELLVQNLGRLDESKNEEDAQGMYNTLGIMENLIEINPEMANTVCEKTQLLSFLLTRLKSKSFDANKFYCAEILSMILQADAANAKRLCTSPGLNGLESLLEILFQYRKRDPDSVEEEECVQDLFLSLCTVLMVPSNQEAFRSAEGFDLLVRFLKERRFAAAPAVKAINFAISGSLRNCEAFVDAGGLKYIFPMFMGRNMPKIEKKKEKLIGKREITESSISIISQLCHQLSHSADPMYSGRLVGKFGEDEFEKLERCCELFIKYTRVLEQTEAGILQDAVQRALRRRQRGLTEEEEEEEEDEEDELGIDSEEARYAKRLDGGLFCLQHLASAIAFACVHEPKALDRVRVKLQGGELDIEDVKTILREAAAAIKPEDVEVTEESSPDDVTSAATLVRTRQQYIEWSAALGLLTDRSAAASSGGSAGDSKDSVSERL